MAEVDPLPNQSLSAAAEAEYYGATAPPNL